MYDVIVIGGGPAGLTAGLYTSRAKLRSLLIEKGLVGGLVTTTEWVENYPGFDEGILGAELARKMEKQATKFGLEIIQAAVTRIAVHEKVKVVTLDDGKEYEAKSVILATGAHPRFLKVKHRLEHRRSVCFRLQSQLVCWPIGYSWFIFTPSVRLQPCGIIYSL